MTMFVPLNTFPYEWPIVVLNLAGRTILTFVVRSKNSYSGVHLL